MFCMCLKGSRYVKKIQQKKEKHIWSGKILEKLLDKGNNSWYDCTPENPICKDPKIFYEVEELHDLSD